MAAPTPFPNVLLGLNHFKFRVAKLSNDLLPAVLDPSPASVATKENVFVKCQSELFFWRQQVLSSCSTEQDATAAFEQGDVLLNECETILEQCHLRIYAARESFRQASTSQNPTPTQPHVDLDFKIERTPPPKFNGDYSEWLNYADLFKAAIIDNPRLSGAMKLNHLKNSLVDDAASMKLSFPATNLSFQDAWDMVEKRYCRKRKIVFSHLQKLFAIPSVPDSTNGILKLVDTINQCLRSIKLLQVPVEHWDVIIVFFAHMKLDAETKKQWLLNSDDNLPHLEDFLSFLENRAGALATQTSSKEKVKGDKSTSSHHLSSVDKVKCPNCAEKHKIYLCPKFLDLSPHERLKVVNAKKLCRNCLGFHQAKDCKSPRVCNTCSKPHHSLLHFGPVANPAQTSNPTRPESNSGSIASSAVPQASTALDTTTQPQVGSHHSSPLTHNNNVVLLATLVVNVTDSQGNTSPCRVFLDQGSEANFVTETLVQRLNLPVKKSCVTISGLGGKTQDNARGLVNFAVQSRLNSFRLPVSALVLPRLTGLLPRSQCRRDFGHLSKLSFSDSDFHLPSTVDILLGSESLSRILLPGLKVGPPGTPTAHNSRFGWFVTGSSPGTQPHLQSFSASVCHSTTVSSDNCLEQSLQRFWELEEPSPIPLVLSSSDQAVESHFSTNVTRDGDGRYEVQLPFQDTGILGESFSKSASMFRSLEKQLDRDPKLKEAYHSQIEAYLSKNWIEAVPAAELSPNRKVKVTNVAGEKMELSPYYLPHHVVVKPDNTTTKFRIVFNASAKTDSGESLNSILHVGPKIQTDLHPLLIRFRSHPVALSGDIVKFYHQVKVFQPHSDFQRFLWRKSPSDTFTHFRFLRVTFGVAPAPYLAIRSLRQLGEDYKETFPLAYNAIQDDFLVDNLLSGATSTSGALEVKSEVKEVLSRGGFQLQKWASNDPKIMDSVSEDTRETFSFDLNRDDSIKTIGLYWHPASDSFGVKITRVPVTNSTTKREVLSHVARVFDPLQWLAPVTISAKILLQSLWKQNLAWDDPLPPYFFKKWVKYTSGLQLLQGFRIPRCLTFTTFTSEVNHDLIGFCDASNVAYAACVYLRSKSESEVKVLLIAAKSKVAPVGGDTTPRLELCSAALLCTLVNTVAIALSPSKITVSNFHCFTDSTGALGQLFSTEKQPVFVLNRVRKIKNSKVPIHWFHVPGDLNPADLATRGLSPENYLQNSLWINGPSFLLTEDFPVQPYEQSLVTFAVTVDPMSTFTEDRIQDLILKTSSFPKMKRLLAYWIRLKNIFRTRTSASGPLTTKELSLAQLSLVKCVQSKCITEELDCCAKKKQSKGPIRFLSPFLDHHDILRVGGRLQLSPQDFRTRHPALLPKYHSKPETPSGKLGSHFVISVVRYFHLANLHAAPKLLLSLTRSEFWIPRGQNLCSRIYRHCVPCHRQHPQPLIQVMGQLPSARVTPDFPFVKVGLDYAGHFEVAATPGRKPRLIKAYVCVFICMATKAVHLEYVGGLSTPDFIAAFQRFCSIRNSPSDIFCDGGSNFIGAKNDMEALQNLLESPQHREKVALFFSGEKVDFHICPAHGPHHGGLWEAAVKSMKLHLHRVVQGHHLSIEEFITLLARTAAALNSRPLTPVSSNPDDFEVITPFHFLSLRAPKFVAEEDVTTMKSHRNRWQLVQQMSQHLFKRWSSDYLQSLQQKHKWLKPQQNIAKGTMVLMQDSDNALKHQRWILGRVAETFPGPDGKVRTCDVIVPVQDRANRKDFSIKMYRRRPITRLSPLPIDDDITSAVILS